MGFSAGRPVVQHLIDHLLCLSQMAGARSLVDLVRARIALRQRGARACHDEDREQGLQILHLRQPPKAQPERLWGRRPATQGRAAGAPRCPLDREPRPRVPALYAAAFRKPTTNRMTPRTNSRWIAPKVIFTASQRTNHRTITATPSAFRIPTVPRSCHLHVATHSAIRARVAQHSPCPGQVLQST